MVDKIKLVAIGFAEMRGSEMRFASGGSFSEGRNKLVGDKITLVAIGFAEIRENLWGIK